MLTKHNTTVLHDTPHLLARHNDNKTNKIHCEVIKRYCIGVKAMIMDIGCSILTRR